MSLEIRSPYEGYPKGWALFERHMPSANPAWMGFAAGIGDINRFAARYRVARAFKAVEVEGYSADTIAGYSALFRVFLVWSAFERFTDVIGVRQSQLGDLLTAYEPERVIRKVREVDGENRFYGFIYNRVNPTHKKEVDNYFRADPCNTTYLASAIRHLFAHGTLTPNVSQIEPKVTVEVCDQISEFLVTVMDEEFSRRVEAFEAQVQESVPGKS